MTRLDPDDSVLRMASDPGANIWVTASAGTGKTTKLVDRVVRLLLAGAAPASILAITFTRTAAAEMRARVLRRLATWTGLDDRALAAELARLGEDTGPEARARARALFLAVLDAPDGLQIRTIHAMAQSILAAFPLEAGLPPRADPLDERGAARLRAEALRWAMDRAAAPGGEGLAADFARVAVEAGETALATHLVALVRARAGYAAIGRPERVEAWLRALVDLPPTGDPKRLLAEALMPPDFEDEAVAAYGPVVRASTRRNDRGAALQLIHDWPGLAATERVQRIEELRSLIYDANGKPRGIETTRAKVPDSRERFDRLKGQIDKVLGTMRALAFVDHAGAWIRIGLAIAERYDQLKRAAAAVDFDDMVGLAADLLMQDGMANFVARKLDRRIAHVLVDEAQDTNRSQWRLIEGLTGDFDAGIGAHAGEVRTRFVVGDFKQAIFRFQGTDPKVFLDLRRDWAARTAGAGNPMIDVPLVHNYRSAPLILALVDRVLAELGPESIGLPPGEALPSHRAHNPTLPGRILLLPAHAREAEEGPGEPDTDDDPESPDDPDYLGRLATTIEALVGEGSPDRLVITPRDGVPRHARPGDVLVLVQARSDLMAGLVRALHARGLPVAGVDRARLVAPLAVRDCLSLIRFVLQPADDLALAEVLTSPLGGLDHETIRAARIEGRSLWESIAHRADLAGPVAVLKAALSRADFVGPHAFLEAVLAAGGRAAFRARLGPEADDGLDLLLAEALAFEADRPATLQGFFAHLAATDEELARDPGGSPGLVRIMTVHGAKGLEAPIVVLADALRSRKPQKGAVLWRSEDGLASLPLIYGSKERKPPAIAELAEAADREDSQEDNRLLYVAMTRARQVLVVAGELAPKAAAARARAAGNEDGLNTWHDRIRRAMMAEGATACTFAGTEGVLLLEGGQWPEPAPEGERQAASGVPPWAREPPPPEPAPPRPFTPSGPLGDEAPIPPGLAASEAAQRGRLIHRLLEKLPCVPPGARRTVALRVLAAEGLTGAPAEAIRDEVLAVLNDPRLADLFGPQALAEAPVAGAVDGHVVSGTVDRLEIRDDRIRVIDFKTGAAIPAGPEAVHPSHLRQMAAYRAVLRAAFPGRPVELVLLFTAGPTLIPLPDAILDPYWPPGSA